MTNRYRQEPSGRKPNAFGPRKEDLERRAALVDARVSYPSPEHVSYDEDSWWCQDHGHTGLLIGSVCEICDSLVRTDPRFAALLGTVHNPDGSRVTS